MLRLRFLFWHYLWTAFDACTKRLYERRTALAFEQIGKRESWTVGNFPVEKRYYQRLTYETSVKNEEIKGRTFGFG